MPTVTVNRVTAHLSDGSRIDIPYWDVNSGKEGTFFLVIANQHGNEVNGCEAIRRFIEVAQRKLKKGRVVGLPFANRLALHQRRPHINMAPEQPYGDDRGHNMNRTWPGDPNGNDTQRLSHAIHEGIAKHADAVLDLHSWSRFTATASIIKADKPELYELARVAAIRFVRVVKGEKPEPQDKPSTITRKFLEAGKLAITIELATQYAIVEHEVQRGLRAALNIAKHLGLMEGEPELDEPVIFLDNVEEEQVKAPVDGLFVEAPVATWDRVEKGQKLGHIIRDDTLEVVEILSPRSGWLKEFGCRREHCDVALPAQHPYASKGDLLASVVQPRES